jgi:hypothetical protein
MVVIDIEEVVLLVVLAFAAAACFCLWQINIFSRKPCA